MHTTKTVTITTILLAVIALTAICVRPAVHAHADSISILPSRPTQVFLTNADLDPNEGLQVIRAFIQTGTLDPNCMTTMGDTSFVADGTIVFCAPRQPAGLGKGVMISVFYPQPPPDGLTLSMTLMQEGALKYAAPVLCDIDGC